MRFPESAPGGTLTRIVSGRSTRPAPPHAAQGSPDSCPPFGLVRDLCAGALADLAYDRPLKRYRGLKAAHRIEEIDFHTRLDVLAARRSALRSRALPENSAEAAKKIAEIVHVKFVGTTGALRLLAPLLIAPRLIGIKPGGEAALAEFIIKFSFLFVAQNIVGNREILEFILGVFVARIDVGMIFARKLAVGLADIVVGSAALDAKNLIVIAICHCISKITTRRRVARESRVRSLSYNKFSFIPFFCKGGILLM